MATRKPQSGPRETSRTEQDDGTRSVGNAVPGTTEARSRLCDAVRSYVTAHELVPPLTMDEIRVHAQAVAKRESAEEFEEFLMVLMGSEIWRETVASLPFDRRILLLPQCLRDPAVCKARVDAFGVLCEGCGACDIGTLQDEAEELGYVVLVAEGTTLVTQLLEQGRVDAVIGVSCLEALEKSFPHLASEAIPGMAVPLNCNGCVNTDVDVERVRELIHMRLDTEPSVIDLEALRQTVDTWFSAEALSALLNLENTITERSAIGWLGRAGKRWRPLLAICMDRALMGAGDIPDSMRQVAVAVECFHKASLLHDDIEDGDLSRYDEPALHVTHGIPVALNVGDLLVGEGYRLIAESGLTAAVCSRMLSVAAEGHRALAIGQGEELAWRRRPVPPTVEWVIDVFAKKTAPAFSVALQLGAIHAGAESDILDVVTSYSRALGIAYQIKDDLDDGGSASEQIDFLEPSILLALGFQALDEHRQADIVAGLHADADERSRVLAEMYRVATSEAVREKATMLFDHYRNEAIRSLCGLKNSELKRLLRRVVARILGSGRP